MIAIFIKSLNLAEETPYYIINNSLTDCSDLPLQNFSLSYQSRARGTERSLKPGYLNKAHITWLLIFPSKSMI